MSKYEAKRWHIEFDLVDKPTGDEKPFTRAELKDRIRDITDDGVTMSLKNLRITEVTE